MAVSQGSFTVGGLAADYPNLATAFGDVASPLTGDLTFTVIDNHSSSAAGTLSGLDLQAHRLTVTADVSPQGNVDGGRIISMAADERACFIAAVVDSIGGGEVVIERLNVRNTDWDYDAGAIYITTGSSGAALFGIVRDCIVDNRNASAAQSGSAIDLLVMPTSASRVHTMYVHNCMVVGHYSQGGSACFELRGQYYGYVVCENCVAQPNSAVAAATGFLITVGDNVVVRNCVGVGGGVTYGDFYGTADAEGYNNMSQDTSAADGNWNIGSGNTASITPADEYTSVDPADGALWFEPKSTGAARDGGSVVEIPGNTYGAITSVVRPHNVSYYSIGAKEYPSAPTISVQPATQTVDEGDPATFDVTALNATGYQWQRKEPLGTTWADVTGATSASYTTPVFGTTSHQAQYRVVVSNAAGDVTSVEVYLLFTGYPLPGSGGAISPNRPTATITEIDHETRQITIAVSGTATVFRAELFDLDSNVVANNQIAAPGDLIITAPERGISYSVIVIAGDGSVPVNWSEPGLASAVVIRPLAEDLLPETGVGVTTEPSTHVREAGPMGAGLAFPFRFSDTTGAPETNYGVDHVVDGMQQILLTRINGRFIRREFGSSIAGKLFAPDTEVTQDTAAAIQGVLSQFEHRAEVTSVVFTRNRAAGTIYADIKFRTYRTHQDGNLVYPFNMGAGL